MDRTGTYCVSVMVFECHQEGSLFSPTEQAAVTCLLNQHIYFLTICCYYSITMHYTLYEHRRCKPSICRKMKKMLRNYCFCIYKVLPMCTPFITHTVKLNLIPQLTMNESIYVLISHIVTHLNAIKTNKNNCGYQHFNLSKVSPCFSLIIKLHLLLHSFTVCYLMSANMPKSWTV